MPEELESINELSEVRLKKRLDDLEREAVGLTLIDSASKSHDKAAIVIGTRIRAIRLRLQELTNGNGSKVNS